MKRKTDIEKLVQWTFCEELPKGGSEAYTPPWERISRYAETGTLADESRLERLLRT
jgi:hypothetical protein